MQYGASKAEVVEVLELVSELGLHTMTVAVPIVVEEAGRFGTTLPPLPASQAEQLKEEFVRLHGYWDASMDAVLHATPEFFSAYLEYSKVPRTNAQLDGRARELIYLGVSAAVTHLHPPAIRLHARNALAAGATLQQLIEVLEIVAVAGVHTIIDSFPIVAEEFSRASRDGA